MTSSGNLAGIEHIGITVPSHAQAIDFFQKAFSAQPLYSLVHKHDQPMGSDDAGPKNGLLPGTAIVAITMLRFAHGPNVEIFEIDRPNRTETIGIADIGITHFSVSVENIETACKQFEEAGGSLLEGPYPLSGQEEGPGNMGRFGLTPWGLLVEFVQLKAPIQYDEGATATRWLPKP